MDTRERSVASSSDGTWKTGQTWWGVKEGAIDLASLSPEVPAPLTKKLDTVKAGLKAGTYAIWKGPIVDQSGKAVGCYLAKLVHVRDSRLTAGLDDLQVGLAW